MNNNETIEALSEEIVMKMKEEEEKEIAIAMKMARELAAERKKKKNGELEAQQLQRRKIEITTFLQQCGTSISSLQSLSIKESRHIENCKAIPEGNENEEEDEDEEIDDDNDDSVVKSVSTTSTDLVNYNTDCNSDIRKGTVKQIEQRQRRRRNTAFHRMKRRFVVAKSVIVAKSA
mmetsp:Transcript_7186/g.7753  ORF Transcript_7186/g.7753 Transcript_7186/m.7753 type:complete len:176 (-) Transcript_7186:232-759(-)